MSEVEQRETSPGKVYLVGAGPGDPGLITVRGAKCLQMADAVLYDTLANPLVLDHASPNARLECVGKHGRTRIWSQHEINNRLVELARSGEVVVRLKGGDPAVFARGVEETEALSAAGVPFEIVPGVTAALAAGSYAGIPVTHRDLASAVALVTAQERDGKVQSGLDYEALARFPGTLVFYMGVVSAPRWTADLIAAGKPPDSPAAIIRRCSLPDQLTVRCRLDEVATLLKRRRLRPPAIVIIGPVTRCAEALSWYERRPLFGTSVLVTRPRDQAGQLAELLQQRGAEVVLQPAVEIAPPEDWGPVDAAIADLGRLDWLVFSSANGVDSFLGRLYASGRDARALGGVRIAAVGSGTARRLASQHRLTSDLVPGRFQAEDLAATLGEQADGKRFLVVRASRGRDILAPGLQARGGNVEQVVAYQSTDVGAPDDDVRRRLEDPGIDWVTVTSSAIGRALFAMFGDALKKTRLASISPLTSATLLELGLPPAAEAESATMAGMVAAIEKATAAVKKREDG